jgi:hypothetical protein
MSCHGVHFALTEQEAVYLRSIEDEDKRIEYLQGTIEHTYFEKFPDLIAPSDKAWDAMHRVLADGELTWQEGGTYPLNHVVLGGELLYTQDDYIISLKNPEQVRDIATALPVITELDFRKRYFTIDPESSGFELSEDDFNYTWGWFQIVRELYERARQENRYVLFTADQ